MTFVLLSVYRLCKALRLVCVDLFNYIPYFRILWYFCTFVFMCSFQLFDKWKFRITNKAEYTWLWNIRRWIGLNFHFFFSPEIFYDQIIKICLIETIFISRSQFLTQRKANISGNAATYIPQRLTVVSCSALTFVGLMLKCFLLNK